MSNKEVPEKKEASAKESKAKEASAKEAKIKDTKIKESRAKETEKCSSSKKCTTGSCKSCCKVTCVISLLAILGVAYLLFNAYNSGMLGKNSNAKKLDSVLSEQKNNMIQELNSIKNSIAKVQSSHNRVKSRLDSLQPDTEKEKAVNVLSESVDLLNLANAKLTTARDVKFANQVLNIVDVKLSSLIFKEAQILKQEISKIKSEFENIEQFDSLAQFNKIQSILNEVTLLKFETKANSNSKESDSNTATHDSESISTNIVSNSETANKLANKNEIANANQNVKAEAVNTEEDSANNSESSAPLLSKAGALKATQSAWQELKALIKVRRIKTDTKLVLNTEDLQMLKQQLSFQLDVAAYALVADKHDYYTTSIDSAHKILESYQMQDTLNLGVLKEKIAKLKEAKAPEPLPSLDKLIDQFNDTVKQFKT